MERIEHTGKTWSSSFLTGRESRRVFRYVDKRTGEQVKGVGSFVGRLRDVTSGAEVGELECSWCENGDIEVIFPDMAVGRYVIAIDHSGQNGEIERFLDGYAGYLEPGYVITGYEEGEEVVVTVCCGDGAREVYALSGDLLKYSTLEAIEAMKRAEAARDEVLEQLSQAMEFVASFDKALRESIQVINNYLWIGGVNTGHYLRGDDGETPRYGADGYWYIGEKRVGKARGDDGITPHITADGYWAFGSQKTSVRAAGRDGIDGTAVRRIVIDTVLDLPEEEEQGVYYYVRQEDNTYDVYVWLEGAGWARVGPANEVGALNLATDKVHGAMKFSAGEQEEGAPVGWKRGEEATAIVPMADVTTAGASKLSTSVEMSNARKDGVIGKSANGELMARRARPGQAGVVEPSRTDGLARVLGLGIIPDGTIVDGLDRSGLFGCTRAEPDTYGMVKAAFVSTSSSCDEILWNIPIAMREDMQEPVEGTTDVWYRGANGMLFVPLAQNGAIRWYSTSQRTKDGKRWSTGGSLTFVHTSQFEQTETGLALLSATSERLAGVYLAADMSDTRSAAVPSAGAVVNYLSEHYYGKSMVYTKQETLTELQTKLNGYASLSWVSDNLMTRTQIMEELKKKLECPSGRVRNIDFMTASERQNLSVIDSKTAYLVYAG